jgi:hypothetical protein
MRTVKTLRKGSFVRKFLELFVKNHEKYRGSYFWKPPSAASQRRSQEFDHCLTFQYKGDVYGLEQSLEFSCKNVYWTSTVYVNEKKKDIRVIHKLIGSKKPPMWPDEPLPTIGFRGNKMIIVKEGGDQ